MIAYVLIYGFYFKPGLPLSNLLNLLGYFVKNSTFFHGCNSIMYIITPLCVKSPHRLVRAHDVECMITGNAYLDEQWVFPNRNNDSNLNNSLCFFIVKSL